MKPRTYSLLWLLFCLSWAIILLALPAVLTLAQAATLPRCDWWPTGRDPYRGSMAAALARIDGIPAAQRDALAARIALGEADDRVTITRTAITGDRLRYAPQIRQMHFGPGSVCATVDRRRWPAGHSEPGAVYRVAGSALAVLIPAVCGNPSAVRVVGELQPASGGTGSIGPAGGGAPAIIVLQTPAPISIEPPAALGAAEAPPLLASGRGLLTPADALPIPALPMLQPMPFIAQPALPPAPAPMPWMAAAAPAIIVAAPLPAPVAAVPEPAAAALLLAGLAVIAARRAA